MPVVIQSSSDILRFVPASLGAIATVVLTVLYSQLAVGTDYSDSHLFEDIYDAHNTNLNFSLTIAIGASFPILLDILVDSYHRLITKESRKVAANIDLISQWMVVVSIFAPSAWLVHTPNRNFAMLWVLLHVEFLILSAATLQYIASISGLTTYINILVVSILCNGLILTNFFVPYFENSSAFNVLHIIDLCLCALMVIVLIYGCYKWALHNFSKNHIALVTPEESSGFYSALTIICWVLGFVTIQLCVVFELPVDETGAGVPLVYLPIVWAIALSALHKRKTLLVSDSSEIALEKKRIFVRHVSHEIRTPLNATTMGLKLMEKELQIPQEEQDPALIEDLLEDMQSSIRIAVEILNDLLLYEKIEAGLMQLEVDEQEAWPFVTDVLRIFRIQAKSKDIDFVWSEEGLDGVMLNIDRYKLSQVIRNMVSNALKFTPSGGRVTVEGRVMRKKNSDKQQAAHLMLTNSISNLDSSITHHSSGPPPPGALSPVSPPQTSHANANAPLTPASVRSPNDDNSNKNSNLGTYSPCPSHNSAAGGGGGGGGGSDYSFSPTKSPGMKKVFHANSKVFPQRAEIVRISVTDSGAGISKRNQKKLFSEIVQFNAAKLQNGQGSGLGLWISNSIVKHHGGNIGVFSAGEGKGSTFYIDIPVFRKEGMKTIDGAQSSLSHEDEQAFRALYHKSLAATDGGDSSVLTTGDQPTEVSTARRNSLQLSSSKSTVVDGCGSGIPIPSSSRRGSLQTSSKSQGSSRTNGSKRTSDISLPNADFYDQFNEVANFFHSRILIVDDAPTNRKLVSRLLRTKIQHRDEAVDGRVACDMVAAAASEGKPYDVIMMDYTMPELDGPGAVREMRASGYTGIIIGVTGNAHESDIKNFTEAGVNEVMIKPLDSDEFWDTVCELLSEKIEKEAAAAAASLEGIAELEEVTTPPKERRLSRIAQFFSSPTGSAKDGGGTSSGEKSRGGSNNKSSVSRINSAEKSSSPESAGKSSSSSNGGGGESSSSSSSQKYAKGTPTTLELPSVTPPRTGRGGVLRNSSTSMLLNQILGGFSSSPTTNAAAAAAAAASPYYGTATATALSATDTAAAAEEEEEVCTTPQQQQQQQQIGVRLNLETPSPDQV